jgi:hypothetical protein
VKAHTWFSPKILFVCFHWVLLVFPLFPIHMVLDIGLLMIAVRGLHLKQHHGSSFVCFE